MGMWLAYRRTRDQEREGEFTGGWERKETTCVERDLIGCFGCDAEGADGWVVFELWRGL